MVRYQVFPRPIALQNGRFPVGNHVSGGPDSPPPGRRNHCGHRPVPVGHRDFVDQLVREEQRSHRNAFGEPSQRAVVGSATPAEPIASRVHRECRHQHQPRLPYRGRSER